MLWILTGPTASGKTRIAERLAELSNGDIISADSRTRYKGFRIGTGRYTISDNINYHIIDDLDPNEFSSSYYWVIKAQNEVNDIYSRGRRPIICGGSVHFIKMFINGIDAAPPPDHELRFFLKGIETRHGSKYLHDLLSRISPKNASLVAPENSSRVIRYIERSLEKDMNDDLTGFSGKYRLFKIEMEREILNRRIRDRTRKMIEMGWVDEVSKLMRSGYSPEAPGFNSIGYRHIISHLDDDISLEEAERRINKDTLDLSRKQARWVRKLDGDTILLEGEPDVDQIVEQILDLVQQDE